MWQNHEYTIEGNPYVSVWQRDICICMQLFDDI